MAADKQRGRQTVRDMVISLAVIVLAAGVIYVFVPHDEDEDPVKRVSYQVELDSARRAAPYPVAAPRGLSDDWRATSVRYQARGDSGSVWHLGFMAPGNEYVAIEQSDDRRPHVFVRDVTRGAEKTGKTRRIAGEDWERYSGPKYDALVREAADGKSTTVVMGTAPDRQLTHMVEALDIRRAPSPSAPASPSVPPSPSPSTDDGSAKPGDDAEAATS
ncbi:DUF4245 domain-containing protein [Streptomyces sp. AJS327]|uniref:DUF4245 domain-containing protein n=1 Tax=Streptomyces sp. AJS327 TaxID=2545265 RepID=UPI0027E5901A|nr:DUF4245 domain-containing protein [Streptomyces sp. AJS327]